MALTTFCSHELSRASKTETLGRRFMRLQLILPLSFYFPWHVFTPLYRIKYSFSIQSPQAEVPPRESMSSALLETAKGLFSNRRKGHQHGPSFHVGCLFDRPYISQLGSDLF